MTKRNTLAVLKHIETLLSLEKHGSISRAAEALIITQSAMTKALQRAEEDLGQALFIRHARGVAPTPAGQLTLEHARIIKNHSAETLNDIDWLRDYPGTLNIGGGASFLDSILPQAVARVVALYPSIKIVLKTESVPHLLNSLIDGELDLLFLSEPMGIAKMDDVEWKPLISNTMDIVARNDHPLSDNLNIKIEVIEKYGWVLGPMNDPQRQFVESVFRTQGRISPRVTVETISRSVAIRLVQQSDLLTLVPSSSVNTGHRDVVRLNCPHLRWVRIAGIATRKGFKLPTGGRALIKYINQICTNVEH